VHQYDYARAYRGEIDPVTGKPFKRERARPVQTLVWYPANGSGKAMLYGDYLRLTGSEDNFSRTDEQIRAISDEFIKNTYASESGPEQAREELAGRMRARRDATPVNGKFPVVIYAPSFSAPAAENADLCEYLASHGYVVIASPSFGRNSREMTSDLEGVEVEAADIAFLVAYAHTLPQANTGEVAVAGYSWGGIANVFAAAHARDAAFELKESELNEWGYLLLRADEPRNAVAIFRLATALYPASADAFDSLAEACQRAGDKQEAIANYQHSLKLNPKNTNARQRLGELGAEVTAGG
jgi:tetratricopeptide (TPR) repeat protein